MELNFGCNISCGITEVTCLDMTDPATARSLIENVRQDMGVNDDGWGEAPDDISDTNAYGLFIWSDFRTTKRTNYGAALAASLKRGKYGEVSITGPRINPNTRHRIWMYVFTPNKKFHDAIGWNQRMKVNDSPY